MTDQRIHPTAVVAANAHLDPTVTVGPFAVIEDDVHIGAGTVIGPHSVVRRYTRMGRNNKIDAHVVIGGLPQHTAFDGGATWVEIGDFNVMREGVTVSRAFHHDEPTRIGSNCFLMAHVHVAHDCQIADNAVLTNGVLLGGHVEIGRNAVVGGASGVHQFARVGPYAMVGAHTLLRKDALPFCMVGGDPVRHYKLNSVGLKRNGIEGEHYKALERAFRSLRSTGELPADAAKTEELALLRDWLAVKSKYGHYGFLGGRRRKS